MFRGKAELLDPESQAVVATFTEDGERMKVVLKEPVTLSGATRLAIYGTTADAEVIAIAAVDGQETEIREFHGLSALGVLSDQSEVSLTRSPGGELGSLLVVLGRGTVHRAHH
jgi:hypothetical protein